MKDKAKKSMSDRGFDLFIYTLAGIMLLVMLYPMYFVIIASISDPAAVSSGDILLYPKGINLKGYKKLLEYSQLWTGYRNTALYTTIGTGVILAVNIPAAYALSRKDLVGRRILTFFYLIPMFFTGGLIPTYLIVKQFQLVDTFTVMVLPFTVITYYIIVARTFFQNSLPNDLWDAARIDGCGNLNFFFKIALPLSKAVLAVIALWSAVGLWNSYFQALIYLRSPGLQPLQIILRNILINNQTISSMSTGAAAAEAAQLADLVKYAIIVVSSAPIMCMYPLVQKHFNQGVMLGAVKA